MTMSTTSLTNAFNGNDVTTEFSFPYTFLEDSDLIVTLTDALGVNTIQTLTTDYTVTGAGVDGGGAVTMIVTPATGESLFIRRTVSLTQEVDYITGDSFPAETHERALDKLTMVAQQQSEAIGRAFKLSDTYSGSASLELPSPEALQLVRWNAAGDAFENTPNLADGIAASEAAASDSATAASGFADNASGFATASSNSAAAASGFADAASDSILNNLTPTDGTILVADGTTWVAESGATARASLGLSSLATLSAVDASTITDNSVGASELNVAGNGNAGYTLNSDGDGTFTWTSPVSVTTGDVLAATAGAGAGGVGTYAFARKSPRNPAVKAFGSTIAGSELTPASAGNSVSGSLAGTWRCTGYADTDGAGNSDVTSWLRIG